VTWSLPRPESAQLVLEDGSVFLGRAFGARTAAVGEVCFNTGMSGYQEVLTDPSYAGQIVVMTAPQIGNYGISPFDEESARPQVAGFVVRNLSQPSNWRSVETLHAYLERWKVPGLCDIDTRAVTRRLREQGAQRGGIAPGDRPADTLLQTVRAWPGLDAMDLAAVVTCKQPYRLQPAATPETAADLRFAAYEAAPAAPVRGDGLHIVAYDFGVKRNILQRLVARGCTVTVVPASTPAAVALDLEPHGILLSNGPGDPSAVGYGIESVRDLLGRVPLFGICLGHQILGLALGGKTFKLKFGHRGVNHPVHDLRSGRVRITSQNHGYALDPDSLAAADIAMTEISLNDGTLEGMEHGSLPVFSVQYHPEASPGPHDNDAHFDRFLANAAAAAGIELPALPPAALPAAGGSSHAAA
jgi:carbamoyl-phosphate synthase small subunit